MNKAIEHILHGKEKHITEEETVLQPLPHIQFRFANPFIVLHHAGPKVILPGSKTRIDPHPHRGFSPVTFIIQGEGFHKDNAGHDETVKEGDAQWMFAGKGLLHSEGPTEHLLNTGGIQEFIQIWVNAPKAHKWDEPFYKSARKDEQPEVLKQEGVSLRLVSGAYDGQTGPLQSFTPVISVVGDITEGKAVHFTATPGYWALLYILKGDVIINGEQEVEMHNLVVFEKNNDAFTVKAAKDTKILFLSAEPIDEPVAAKDNFVMNTPEEIEQAMNDYKNGVFGTLDFKPGKMNEAYKNIPLVDNTAAGRFEMDVEGHKAIIEYMQKEDVLFLTHTEVPQALEGKGVGAAIVEKALHYIEANNYKLVPYCPFVVSYIKRHPEWKRILRDENSLDDE